MPWPVDVVVPDEVLSVEPDATVWPCERVPPSESVCVAPFDIAWDSDSVTPVEDVAVLEPARPIDDVQLSLEPSVVPLDSE